MNLGRSANPALNTNTFTGVFEKTGTEVMTLQGAVNKVFIMLFLLIFAAAYTWSKVYVSPEAINPAASSPWIMGGAIGGFIVALITIFKKSWSAITVPIYSVLEGLFLGGLSALFEAQFPGIVMKAVALTFATLFSLLFAYKSGLIKPTENFKLGVVAATGGIALAYLVTFILGFFGINAGFMYDSSPLSIGISLIIVVVAALNLVLDFDFIEQGAKAGVPKYMEWYAAFGLVVTLIWLYIELLRLLSKLANRRN